MIPAARRRLMVLYVVVAALLISLGGRLWYLQVMTGVSYASAAAQDQTRTVIVPSVRGGILDDVGQPLIDNKTSLVVSVNRALVAQQPDGGLAELRRLAKLLHMKYALLQQRIRLCAPGVSQPCWQGSPYQPIPVDQQASDATALQIMESQREFPGVTAQVLPVIHYQQPYGTAAAQILGYLQPITPQEVAQRHLPVTGFSGVDLVGQAGLEEEYDRQLRGTAGRQVLSVNAAGEVTAIHHQVPAAPGDTLVTSINSQLQRDTQQALEQAISRAQAEGNLGATTGAAVVMTTRGRVVAMASYPTYNPSVWTGGISARQFRDLFGTAQGEPILNRATQGEYAPGSTWKVTSTAAAIARGFSTAGPYGCPGAVTVAGHTFNNWTTQNLGPMSLHEALVMSCDTVFYQIAYQTWLHDNTRADLRANPKAPVQQMQRMELAWGFGRNTGIDLPEESPGTVPTRQWLYNYWKQYKNYWCKHGQPVRQLHPADRVRQLQQRVRVDARPGGERLHRPGLCDGHPAPARAGLRGAGQRGHPVQPADRRGAAFPVGKAGRQDHAAGHRPPAHAALGAGLHPQRADRCGHPGNGGGRVRRVPAEQAADRGQDRDRRGRGRAGHLRVRLVRAREPSPVRGGGDGPEVG